MGRPTTSLLSRWASFRFWLATKRFRKDRDYIIVRGKDDSIYIEILRGKYKNIVFTFDNIQIIDDENGGCINFVTVVRSNPEWRDITSKGFRKIVDNIFRALIRDIQHEAGKADTTEPDQERDFYEESSPVLEKRILHGESRKKTLSADSNPYSDVQQAPKRKRVRSGTARKNRPE